MVPPAAARRGSHIAPGVVLMPSYVNIGAYVDSGTMVDTGSTVGSCAQIGKTFIYPAASVSAVYWNHCKPAPPSSKTTASSARVPKWSRASSSNAAR